MEIPSDSAVKSLAEQYAALVVELESGDEPLLVLPTAEFFPDQFRGDEASVGRLVARMQGYAGLEDTNLEVRIVGEIDASTPGGGCGSGACGVGVPKSGDEPLARVVKSGDSFLLQVPSAELRHSIVLTSRLATALGAVYLLERHPEGADLVKDPALPELMALELGFGVLLLEASYLYAKSCGGPSVQRATALAPNELAVLFSFFLARYEHPLRKALGELGTTQKALVKQAAALVTESPGLTNGLESDLSRIARGQFKVREGRSLLSRWFGGATKSDDRESREAKALALLEQGGNVDEVADLLSEEPVRKAQASPRSRDDDELRAAVDEALGEMRRASGGP